MAARGLAVGGGGHDQPQHFLHAPAIAHEFRGQPIQQLRVGGRRALRSEIFAGLHNAAAEQLLPVAIHRDARGERVVVGYQPVGQAQAIGHLIVGQRIEDEGNSRAHLVAEAQEGAANMHVGAGPLEGILFAHDQGGDDAQLASSFSSSVFLSRVGWSSGARRDTRRRGRRPVFPCAAPGEGPAPCEAARGR